MRNFRQLLNIIQLFLQIKYMDKKALLLYRNYILLLYYI